MADFILCPGAGGIALARLAAERMTDAGLSFDVVADGPWGALLLRETDNDPHESFAAFDNGDFILRSGFFSREGKAGRSALENFFRAFDPARPGLQDAMGQFCLVIRKAGKIYLLSDALGCNKIYHDTGHLVFSNLFVGAAENAGSLSLDLQGCYEYAWSAVTSGEKTFFRELRCLPAEHMASIAADGAVALSALPPLELHEEDDAGFDIDGTVERHLARLRRVIADYISALGGQVNLLVSGGYDSRLLLALLLDAGVRPRLTVYGQPSDLDCRIAAAVAEGEGLDCERIDKSREPVTNAAAIAAQVAHNYGRFDGWKVSGLFDNGADADDRSARVAGGWLKMNGSVGEIYRNFFYLPGRRLSARQLVATFYARYDPSACTAEFDAASYETQLAGEVETALRVTGRRLTRAQVELAYPLFRARYWTARDVPINQGFGPFLVPFMEPSVIRGTCDIPLAWKNHGRFEARMIRSLSARLAAYPTSYGHSFAVDPPLSRVLRSQTTYRRPIWLRRLSYRLQQRGAIQRPWYLSPAYLAAVIDPDLPVMSRLFTPSAIHDNEVFNRVATLEYLCEKLRNFSV